MPRLLLLNPNPQKLNWVKNFQLPPLSLLQVAASVPLSWDIQIADETIEDLPDPEGWDLVGITAMTYQAPRAYQMADRYRAMGCKVVLGGIHPSVLPHEAKGHADSVVIGEAEPVMGGLLEDLSAGNLAPFYRAEVSPGTVLHVPMPRLDLISEKRYLTRQVLQTTRGCPHDCCFCAVAPHFGRRFRRRPARQVLAEVSRFPGKFMVLLDDNAIADLAGAEPLLRGFAGAGKSWVGQVTPRIGEEPKLLELVAESGCMGVFAGVEDADMSADETMSKHRGVRDMGAAVRRIQDAGILVEGSFVFGLDGHDEGVFERAVRFAEKNALCNATFHLLTPYPGTEIYRRFDGERRLLSKDWSRYSHSDVVFKPRRMSPERLYRGWVEARKEVHSWRSIFSRASRIACRPLSTLAYNILRKGHDDGLSPGWTPVVPLEGEGVAEGEAAGVGD